MEIKKSEKGYPEIVLFDETIKREDYYSGSMLTVTYEQDRNRFNIFLWKGGDTIEKVYGDWDIEEWLFIKAEDGKAFVRLCCAAANVKPPKDKYNFRHVFDVLQNHFSGDMKVFHRLKKLMEDQEFPHKFEYYH